MYIVFTEKTKQHLLTNRSLLSQGVVDVALLKCHMLLIQSMCLKPNTLIESGGNMDGLVSDGELPGDPSIPNSTA